MIKININRKDIFFLVGFEIITFFSLNFYIDMNLSNCGVKSVFLDDVLNNFLIILPMVMMPLLFVFDVKTY
jgi:hypothetical protein